MIKRILALIAILTGLTAVAAPVHARIASVEAVGIQASRDSATKCADKRLVMASPGGMAFAARKGASVTCPPPVITIVIPTVMLQADRARE